MLNFSIILNIKITLKIIRIFVESQRLSKFNRYICITLNPTDNKGKIRLNEKYG